MNQDGMILAGIRDLYDGDMFKDMQRRNEHKPDYGKNIIGDPTKYDFYGVYWSLDRYNPTDKRLELYYGMNKCVSDRLSYPVIKTPDCKLKVVLVKYE